MTLSIEVARLRQQSNCRYCEFLRQALDILNKRDMRTTKVYLILEAGKPIIMRTNAGNDPYHVWYFLYHPYGQYCPH